MKLEVEWEDDNNENSLDKRDEGEGAVKQGIEEKQEATVKLEVKISIPQEISETPSGKQ